VFARSSFSAPASFSYCSVGFPMPAGKNPVSASAYFC
jgi:hypothetical protein